MKLGCDQDELDKQLVVRGCSGEDDKPILNSVDSRFNHSWTPSGPGLGWFWIPRGRLCLDILYLASKEEVRRFGHIARKLRATHPPHSLAKYFAAVVNPSTMAHPNRPTGKRC